MSPAWSGVGHTGLTVIPETCQLNNNKSCDVVIWRCGLMLVISS